MRERLTIQTSESPVLAVVSISRTNAVATVTTVIDHGYVPGDYVLLAGVDLVGSPPVSEYNGKVKVVTAGSTTFTCAADPTWSASPTGTMTVVYASDAQGGRKSVWSALAIIPAELITGLVSTRLLERLQMAAIRSEVDYRFRVRVRTDITPTMRALWTPSWPPGSVQQTLEINGALPDGDGRTWLFLDCAKVQGV